MGSEMCIRDSQKVYSVGVDGAWECPGCESKNFSARQCQESSPWPLKGGIQSTYDQMCKWSMYMPAVYGSPNVSIARIKRPLRSG